MVRITKIERSEIEKNQVAILQKTAKELNTINLSGDTGDKAGMATAGSGDVLNGTIAAMFGLGLGLKEAVRTGTFIHGLAGDLVSKEKGADGMTAQDILDFIPQAVKYYREHFEKISQKYYNKCYII
jgi:hypothetical protein